MDSRWAYLSSLVSYYADLLCLPRRPRVFTKYKDFAVYILTHRLGRPPERIPRSQGCALADTRTYAIYLPSRLADLPRIAKAVALHEVLHLAFPKASEEVVRGLTEAILNRLSPQ